MSKLMQLARAGYEFEKSAGVLGVAQDLSKAAKGVGQVGAHLVKTNPAVAKAAVGGVAAGALAARAMQTKQAEEKNPYGAVRHIGDAVGTAISGYGGKLAGGAVAAVTSRHNTVSGHAQRVGFGKGLGLAAGVAMGVSSAVARKENHEKYAAAVDRALKKEEKDDGGPVNVTGGGKAPKAKSSLVAAAQAEMAKEASLPPPRSAFAHGHTRLVKEIFDKGRTADEASEAVRATSATRASRLSQRALLTHKKKVGKGLAGVATAGALVGAGALAAKALKKKDD